MQKPIRLSAALLALAVFIGACAPAESPQEVEGRILTSVAQTIAAQDQMGTFVAQTVAAQNPTETSIPMATWGPSPTPLPTFTPLSTSTPFVPSGSSGGSSSGGSGDTGSGGAGAPKYDCALVNQKPHDGTLFKPGDSFDVVWTIKNTGAKKILGGYPFQYVAGTDMSPTPDLVLGSDLAVGATTSFRIEVIAPAVEGNEEKIFWMQWALIVEGDKICKPYIGIRVQRPQGQ